MTEYTEYKAGTPFEFPVPNHKIEWVKLTEQQILEKTIEYLNIHSNCFKSWESGLENGTSEPVIKCLPYDKKYFMQRYLCYLLYEHEAVIHAKETYQPENIMAIEFSLAYNIIKDLAQHGPNN